MIPPPFPPTHPKPPTPLFPQEARRHHGSFFFLPVFFLFSNLLIAKTSPPGQPDASRAAVTTSETAASAAACHAQAQAPGLSGTGRRHRPGNSPGNSVAERNQTDASPHPSLHITKILSRRTPAKILNPKVNFCLFLPRPHPPKKGRRAVYTYFIVVK